MSAGTKQLLAPFVSHRIDNHGSDTNWGRLAPAYRVNSLKALSCTAEDDRLWFCKSKRSGGCDGYVSESHLRAKGLTDENVSNGAFDTAWATYTLVSES